MSFLDELNDEQKDKLVSLPYRVGLWISQSDDTGGEDADAQEQETLVNIIDGYARDVFGSEMLQYIMREAIVRKDQWSTWEQGVDAVPRDCEIALDIIKFHGDEKDVHAFQNHLIEIGEAVAMAFTEYEVQGKFDEFLLNVRFFIDNMKARLAKGKAKSMHEFLSISPKERAALGELAQALGTSY